MIHPKAPAVINTRLLILSDQEVSAEFWSHAIRRQGICVDCVDLDRTSQYLPRIHEYDLCIIDINDRDADGVSLCRTVRGALDNPLLVLTYLRDERVLLQLYREGADECVIKPVGPVLLIAKMKAWLRRASGAEADTASVHYSDLHLEMDLRRLTVPDGSHIKLSNLECRLVFLLLSNRGQVVPTEAIVDQVWRGYGDGDSSLLKRLVYRLRRKIEPEPSQPRFIESVPGIGYRFRLD